MAGVFARTLTHEDTRTPTNIYVTKEGQGMLLSCSTAEALGLVHFTLRVHLTELGEILENFQDLFQGIGCLGNKMSPYMLINPYNTWPYATVE